MGHVLHGVIISRPRVHTGLPTRVCTVRTVLPPCFLAAPVLVSFDVDGTLIKSVGEKANWLHREAFTHAFKQVCNLDTAIEVIKHHGSTDPLILIKVQEHHGISKMQVKLQVASTLWSCFCLLPRCSDASR